MIEFDLDTSATSAIDPSPTVSSPNASSDQRARSAAAERMRRHRKRRRDGLRCLTIELRETEVWTLINKGLLRYETRNDVGSIKHALYAFLDQALG
jgi:hypothetical protein